MTIDLNLLIGLDAILDEGSVTGAAERLHLSVPAMSRQLNRIRRATGDPIMVRSGRGLVPTPYALGLRTELREILDRADALMTGRPAVDPAALNRIFTIRASDAIVTILGAELIAGIAVHAPNVGLRFVAEGDEDPAALRHGSVDLDIGALDPMPPDITVLPVTTDVLAVVARPELVGAKRLTLDRFCAIPHIMVSRRGRAHGPIDERLGALGRSRRVAATVPSFTVVPFAVAQSDVIGVIPHRLATVMCRDLPIVERPIPLDLPGLDIGLSWHSRFDLDAEHRWLRDQVAAAMT